MDSSQQDRIKPLRLKLDIFTPKEAFKFSNGKIRSNLSEQIVNDARNGIEREDLTEDDENALFQVLDLDEGIDFGPAILKGEIEYDDLPQPFLTEEEKTLPNSMKELLIMKHKCKLVGRFDIIPRDILTDILDPPGRDGTDFPGIMIIGSTENPWNFIVHPPEDYERLYILSHWLTHMFESDALEKFDYAKGPKPLLHQLVVAYCNYRNTWNRAMIEKIYKDERYQVNFIDFGRSECIMRTQIRRLPTGITHISPYCLNAKLDNVEIPPGCEIFKAFVGPQLACFVSVGQKVKFVNKGIDAEGNLALEMFVHTVDAWVDVNKVMRKSIATLLEQMSPAKKLMIPSLRDSLTSFLSKDEVELKVLREVPDKSLKRFKIGHITNIHNFFVDVISDEEETQKRILTETLDSFYNPTIRKFFKVRTENIIKDKIYVYNCPYKDEWFRVRALDYNQVTGNYGVLFVDYGEIKYVEKENLWESHPNLGLFQPLTLNCSLINVKPLLSESDHSQEATNRFKELAVGRTFIGVCLNIHVPEPGSHTESQLIYQVVLIEEDPTQKDLSIQAQLFNENLVDSDGIACGYPNMFDEIFKALRTPLVASECMEKFDEELAEMAKNESVKLGVRGKSSNRNLRLNGPKNIELSNVIGGIDYKPEQDKVSTTLRSWFLSKSDSAHHLPIELRRKLGWINISTVCSMSCFYIHLQRDAENLNTLMEVLDQHVEVLPPVKWWEICLGSTVAAFVSLEITRKNVWQRGFVSEVKHLRDKGIVKVVLVDFGIEETVEFKFVRHLPKYLELIPGFAYRVHLQVKDLWPSANKGWTEEANNHFRSYLIGWNTMLPVYYAVVPKNSTCIQLSGFGEELNLNRSTYEWSAAKNDEPSNLPAGIVSSTFTTMRKHPMASNLFKSLGIEVFYQIFERRIEKYSFAPIWDSILTNGLARYARPTKNFF